MATNFETQVKLISELIVLNNDRIEGYDLAISKTSDPGKRKVFAQFARQSRDNVIVLSSETWKLGAIAPSHSSISGKLFRVWMEIKTAIMGVNEDAVLDSCEYGEDMILEAYNEALESDTSLTSDLRGLISKEKLELQRAYNTIRQLREMQIAA